MATDSKITEVGLSRQRTAAPPAITVGETATVIAGQFLALAGGFALVKTLTASLAPRDYGVYALGWSAVTLAQQMLTGPLGQAISRHYRPAADSGCVAEFRAATEKLVGYAILSIAALAALTVAVLWLGNWPYRLLVVAVSAYTMIAAIGIAIDSVFLASRRRALMAAHQAAAQWSRCLFVLLLVRSTHATAESAVLGMAAGSLPSVLSQMYFLGRLKDRDSDALPGSRTQGDILQEMIGFALPFCTWGLFTWAQLVSDRWALAVFIGPAATGYYNAIYQAGFYPMQLCGGILMQLVLPYLYDLAGDGTDRARMKNSVRRLIQICLVCLSASAAAFFAAGAFHKELSRIILGTAYQGNSYLIPIAVLSGGLFVTAQVLSLIHSVEKTTKKLLAPKVGSAIFGACANALTAYWWGLKGVLIGGLSTAVVYLIAVVVVNRKELAQARPANWGRRGE